MYDPTIGVWVSEDPIGFEAGDENLRRYVGNSSTNAIDPSGQELVFQPGFTPAQEQAVQDAWDRGKAAARLAGSDIAEVFGQQISNQVRNITYRRLRQYFETPTEQKPNSVYMQLGDTPALTPQEVGLIGSVFSKTAIGMDRKDVCVYYDGTSTDSSAYVRTRALGYYKIGIYITSKFWEKDASKQAGIMFHEASHYFVDTVDHDYIGVDANPDIPKQVPIYEDTQHLSTDKAIDNASTYEHYLIRFYIK